MTDIRTEAASKGNTKIRIDSLMYEGPSSINVAWIRLFLFAAHDRPRSPFSFLPRWMLRRGLAERPLKHSIGSNFSFNGIFVTGDTIMAAARRL